MPSRHGTNRLKSNAAGNRMISKKLLIFDVKKIFFLRNVLA
jgi:hypothetical protein